MSDTLATNINTTMIRMNYGPHAGDIIKGNFKISTDKNGRMCAHRWARGANRWIRCDLTTALAS